jgi:hypothetical protein
VCGTRRVQDPAGLGGGHIAAYDCGDGRHIGLPPTRRPSGRRPTVPSSHMASRGGRGRAPTRPLTPRTALPNAPSLDLPYVVERQRSLFRRPDERAAHQRKSVPLPGWLPSGARGDAATWAALKRLVRQASAEQVTRSKGLRVENGRFPTKELTKTGESFASLSKELLISRFSVRVRGGSPNK